MGGAVYIIHTYMFTDTFSLVYSRELMLRGMSALEGCHGGTSQHKEWVRSSLAGLACSMDAK